jgi:hypothetical protein
VDSRRRAAIITAMGVDLTTSEGDRLLSATPLAGARML